MTTTLAHPAAEDLGRFVEGTIDDAGRIAVVTHIADCDECRIVVVDAAEFVEQPVVVRPERKWWAAAAAAIVIAISGSGIFVWQAQLDPQGPMIKAFANQKSRPIDARLHGYPYVARIRMRGAGETDDIATLELQEAASDLLKRRGDKPKMQHAKGVAHILTAQTILAEIRAEAATNADVLEAKRREVVRERDEGVGLLQSAAIGEPGNASYQSDLAAALIATGKTANLKRAIDACDQALRIDHRSPDALFNRAIALQALPDTKRAVAAFKLYLTVDSSSPWANEARTNLNDLQEGL
jgi:tetratricopeptide (TPR) repeat protein